MDPLEPFDAREAARVRRRDHDLDAEHRDLMRPGMGKVFKQILDHQVREGAGEPTPAEDDTARTPDDRPTRAPTPGHLW